MMKIYTIDFIITNDQITLLLLSREGFTEVNWGNVQLSPQCSGSSLVCRTQVWCEELNTDTDKRILVSHFMIVFDQTSEQTAAPQAQKNKPKNKFQAPKCVLIPSFHSDGTFLRDFHPHLDKIDNEGGETFPDKYAHEIGL